jgi:GNAT superfamily N-acetyltransferase
MSVRILHAESPALIALVRELFLEYADWLGPEVRKRHLDHETETLPGGYASPRGCLLLAEADGHQAGCVALRAIDAETCEMKRFYVRPQFRGKGIGRKLVNAVISEARLLGYRRMRLDTIPNRMPEAVMLYRALGFREIPPYRPNPVAGSLCMESEL